jgi:hypothetical protein
VTPGGASRSGIWRHRRSLARLRGSTSQGPRLVPAWGSIPDASAEILDQFFAFCTSANIDACTALCGESTGPAPSTALNFRLVPSTT